MLTRQVLAAVDDAVAEAGNPGPFDEQRWPDVFMEVIRPLVRNMRDVRRYGAAVYGTVRALRGQIALVDVLALETVRVFLPDTFKRIAGSVDALTTTSNIMSRTQHPPGLKAAVDDMLNVPDDRKALLGSVIQRVSRQLIVTSRAARTLGRTLRRAGCAIGASRRRTFYGCI